MHGLARTGERVVQIFAILIGAVFLLSGVLYLYSGVHFLDESPFARDQASGTPTVETVAGSPSPLCNSHLRLTGTLSGVVLVQKRTNFL